MIFLWQLENIRTPFFNEIMQFVTYFGQELLIIAVICALYWCADKRFAYYLGFTYFTAGFCVQALKITFRIPRPWILDPEFKAVKSAIPAATSRIPCCLVNKVEAQIATAQIHVITRCHPGTFRIFRITTTQNQLSMQ